jgi:uncharacterized damage-inducible protein DinB
MEMQASLERLGRYHQWAGDILLDHLAGLDDDAWYRDEGLFFRSIHRTLNHLLLVDRIWLGRIREKPYEFNGLGDELEVDRHALVAALREQWQAVRDYIESGDAIGSKTESDITNTQGQRFTLEKVAMLQHLVNHGTHHRGQISAVLTRLGHPAPAMDLGYMLYEEASPVSS